jgi:hypothetical protein
MPTKKDLAALLSETPQRPLRRGRGLRLSRPSKQAQESASKPSGMLEPSSPPESSSLAESSANVAVPSPVPDAAAPGADIPAGEPIESVAATDADTLKPERKKRKILLRKDLLKQCKQIARAQDRKLYEVIESALEEYLQRHGAHE